MADIWALRSYRNCGVTHNPRFFQLRFYSAIFSNALDIRLVVVVVLSSENFPKTFLIFLGVGVVWQMVATIMIVCQIINLVFNLIKTLCYIN